jgi:hypothetical protein
MVDEFINTFVTTHMIVYLSILEHGQPTTMYLTLIPTLKVFGTTSFQVILENLKKLGLDMIKCVGFGLDVAFVMTWRKKSLTTKLNEVNHHLMSMHFGACIHALAIIGTSKKLPGCVEIIFL